MFNIMPRQYSILLLLIFLTLFVGSVLIYLVPFVYSPNFNILPGPFYKGKAAEYKRVLEQLVEVEGQRLARQKARLAEDKQLRILHKYANRNAKNVSGVYNWISHGTVLSKNGH